nr:MAG TPA: hypothetical protein [Caudoviricetes sp.]
MRRCNFNYGEFAIFEIISALYPSQSKQNEINYLIFLKNEYRPTVRCVRIAYL